ncbi:MAG: alginate O-acetyltransferase AlgX-related protein [Bacteroidia bacterium]
MPLSITQNKALSIKRRIFALLTVLLSLPLFQLTFPFIKEAQLLGVAPAPDLPKFSVESWYNEQYQKSFASVLEQRIGFHPAFVRIHNQINYSLFSYSDAGDVVIGKDGYIYLKPYVQALTGDQFIGTNTIRLQTEKLKVIQAQLKKRGIDFFVVLAPGKGSFYSEYIPDDLKARPHSDTTNYDQWKKYFEQSRINYLDLRSYFAELKKQEKYPLFSKTGVHWSEYGCYKAGEKLVAYIGSLRKIELPKIELKGVKKVLMSGNKSTDYDAASLMNIYGTVGHAPAALPELSYTSTKNSIRPRFLCISDSYFAGISNTGIPSNVFSDYHNWLYFDRVFPESYLDEKHVADLNIKKELEKQDIVCILCTDASLGVFPFGFADAAYELYAPKDSAYSSLKNQEYSIDIYEGLRHIDQNPDWKAALEWNAKEKGISPMESFIDKLNEIYREKQKKISGK